MNYEEIKAKIESRLSEFKKVPEQKYFYELCFCLCTPQSKAANALIVQNKLEDLSFLTNPDCNPLPLLNDKKHYIRFHNQKAQRLLKARSEWHRIKAIINSDLNNRSKRDELYHTVNGFGMKESSHFLRNIGYEGLAILDRHILKNLIISGVFTTIPKIGTIKQYHEVENRFHDFSRSVGIPIDHLDLLFWSNEAGEIIK